LGYTGDNPNNEDLVFVFFHPFTGCTLIDFSSRCYCDPLMYSRFVTGLGHALEVFFIRRSTPRKMGIYMRTWSHSIIAILYYTELNYTLIVYTSRISPDST